MPKLIIERNSEWNNKARKIGIYIDGEKLGTIDDGTTQEYYIESGEHEVYAKIDWCRSQNITINTYDKKRTILRLTGFKYGSWILPIMLGLFAIYYLLTYFFDLELMHAVWIPIIVLLYPTYYITIGRNQYLILKEI